jgi:enoyl-CoA hydratase
MLRCEHIRSARSGRTGRLTLDRPAKLNALSLEMIRELAAVLAEWADDTDVDVVVLDGAGPRGFCAGGDVRAVQSVARVSDAARRFWSEEYRLNAQIAAYEKPLVVLMPGIVMGGGVGLASHARHPVVCETTRLAMPETAIGLIPDVGSSWLLSRAPGESGTYLALTGAHIGAADAIAMGFAKYFVPQASLEPLTQALLRESPRGDEAVAATIARFEASPGDALLAPERTTIDRAFAYDTVEQIVRALLNEGSPFAHATQRRIAAQSPTSLKLTLRMLREARTFARLADCFRLEFRLISRLVSEPDFHEGVRAALIDKDRKPRWIPADLRGVSPSAVDGYFASLGADELRL